MKMEVLVYPLIGVMLVSDGKTLSSLPGKKLLVPRVPVGASKRAIERDARGLRVLG